MDLVNLGFFVAIGAVIWFLIIKPEMDKRKEHDKLLSSLAKDDAVVTNSGLHGKVVKVADDTVVLEISEKTKVTLDKMAIARRQADPASKA